MQHASRNTEERITIQRVRQEVDSGGAVVAPLGGVGDTRVGGHITRDGGADISSTRCQGRRS